MRWDIEAFINTLKKKFVVLSQKHIWKINCFISFEESCCLHLSQLGDGQFGGKRYYIFSVLSSHDVLSLQKSQMSDSNCMTRISAKLIPLAISEKCVLALQSCFNMYVQLHFGTFLQMVKYNWENSCFKATDIYLQIFPLF